MQPTRHSLNYEESARNSLTSDEASPTLWALDEGTEDETNRVIWKASQPQDPVLNQLLHDAYVPRKSPRLLQSKSWTSSFDLCSMDASSSTMISSDRAVQLHRASKRRPHCAGVLPEEATATHPENKLDESIHRLVALLPLVSKQADENAKREQDALREKRRRQKRTERHLSAVMKKYKPSLDVKGKRRAIDVDNEEEETMVAEESFGNERLQHARNSQPNDVRPPESSLSMPPPPFVPLRKSWSAGSDMFFCSTQRSDPYGCFSGKTERIAEPLSFTPSSFIATSTPLASSNLASTNKNCSGSRTSQVDTADDNPNSHCVSIPASAMPSVENTHPHPHTPSPTMPYHAQCPSPLSRTNICAPAPHAPARQISSLPKAIGPPVLGMRRLVNGQAPSASQNRPLPVKQDRFKVPFSKDRHGDHVGSVGSVGTPIPTSGSGSASTIGAREKVGCNGPVPIPGHYLNGYKSTSDTSVHAPPAQLQQEQASSITRSRVRDAKVIKTSDGRSSPPPEEADSSFDFDMGFDPDELERVCSVYD